MLDANTKRELSIAFSIKEEKIDDIIDSVFYNISKMHNYLNIIPAQKTQ